MSHSLVFTLSYVNELTHLAVQISCTQMSMLQRYEE